MNPIILLGAAALLLLAGKTKASGTSERQRCIDVVAIQGTDFIIAQVELGKATPDFTEDVAAMMAASGNLEAEKCIRANANNLRACRQLLIAAFRQDLQRSTPEQLEAQAEMIEAVGGPIAVVTCLRTLARG
jgi:hypothetical protein